MIFVKTDMLKSGMRIARPIYNKDGVMLYERNTKLSNKGIASIQNFGLIGVYILEAAEPIPPMTDDDIRFERFQAMSVFTIKDILDAVCRKQESKKLYPFANQVLKNYGSLDRKVNFIQNVRSKEDYVFKHSLNTAILAAMISHKLGMDFKQQLDIVVAAILHDTGSQLLPLELRCRKKSELTEEEIKKINTYHFAVYQLFNRDYNLEADIRRYLTMLIRFNHKDIAGDNNIANKILAVEVLKAACVFDNMTAMNFEEEPISKISAVKQLILDEDTYDIKVVNALIESINILQSGVCVELTNGDKGLVVTEGTESILEPYILSFSDNKLYNLADKYVARNIQIKDVMKTMDNRHKISRSLFEEYKGKVIH